MKFNHHTNAAIQETYGNLVLMKVESTKKEKKEIEDKIESETQRVLGSLSEGELDAISELLEGQPDPKAILQSLGISPILQDKLMDIIKAKT